MFPPGSEKKPLQSMINCIQCTYNRRFFIILSPPPPVFAIYRNLNNQDQGIYHEVDLFTISTITYT